MQPALNEPWSTAAPFVRNAPLFRFNRHSADIEREVVQRAMTHFARQGDLVGPRAWQLVLNDAAYHEINRLEDSRGRQADRLQGWQKLARRIGRMSEAELREEVERLSVYYVKDITGHFNKRVYRFTSSVLPVGLAALFNAADPKRLGNNVRAIGDLSTRLRVEGELDALRRCFERGTVVLVPTHSSNLDSIVLGWSLLHLKQPPVSYGAGKNLFTNPLIGYFMRNLGAYRVDRRLRHTLYKEVLKLYSQVLLERGYHSLFFPGGTRARSGEIEQHLKLGLLGSAQAAFAERLRRGDDRPLYIVPVTINYPLVLEAQTLIEDHLKASGQARYIIEDDEFSQMGRVSQFALKLMALDTSMVLRFAAPLDVFGNAIDEQGRSVGPNGSEVNPAHYLMRAGQQVSDAARDAEYTRQLGRHVAQAFTRETVLLPTQVVAWTLFERERRLARHLDLFALLRTTSGDRHARHEMCVELERVRARLVALERAGELRLDRSVRSLGVEELLEDAARSFGMYHPRPALELDERAVSVGEAKLLYYYGNRLTPWADRLREAQA